ncbi:hypothetical protein G6M89_20915 [Natronolimnobius sp. AArcel1]|uniref:hypothetical protein n=1 Tax=Natronolimnobius sp. AArcel1 TaxID=1679093 RepID=UPI0013ECE42D|nr:hypothetical protein [Natronolimnobius sp. AArcel1]NGM71423.1 hypothetical protein [Natronolimnobius sp. AArcel1]
MDTDEYIEGVRFSLQDHEYKTVETDKGQFEGIYTKTKTVSYLDRGRECRCIAPAIVGGDLSLETVRSGIDALESVAESGLSSDTVGVDKLSSTPLFPAFITNEPIDGVIKERVSDMDSAKGNDLKVPILVEVSEGGRIRSGGVSLTYPVPPRRQLPKRRAVKSLVSAIFDA